MRSPVITVEHLSKRYIIGHQKNQHDGLRHKIETALRNPWRWLGEQRKEREAVSEEFWALKDVSFAVNPGEVVGIIGRNGAGKSTLLKILSRITEPTAGRVHLKGRSASLLEVGTGFHPELTGRENIFLNGAILGMSKVEIKSKFDEIVSFSELEKFLDTPVKRYSSGMFVRLAFAVAAHLEPEILIVDEVLAVGDTTFQKKCLNKMEDVGAQGRTILFVSHDLSAVTRLCKRVILLANGVVLADGASYEVAGFYLRSGQNVCNERIWPDARTAPQNHVVRLCALRVRDSLGKIKDIFDVREPIGIEMEYDVLEAGHQLVSCLSLRNESGVLVCLIHDHASVWYRKPRPIGHYRNVVWIPDNLMAEGTFYLGAAVGTHVPADAVHFSVADLIGFQVLDPGEGDSARGDYGGRIPGVIRPHLKWDTEYSS